MNKPFKPDILQPILADVGVSITDLKRNPAAVIAAAREQQVAILNRNRPVGYIVSPEVWDYVCDLIEDMQDAELVRERLAEPGEMIEVSIDDL
ncbi:MAG: type II toxin-antitoxin system prevent-host-death family antitoxin [Sphingobium sp.]|nr:type II toxin-antitoxin system prevent-host-death family antitoxin [Sphingobium sp.]MBP6112728.1 type II toxin-antitoxin system prevent-host-death family antitoxin [Sphingobium sp.]MBP8670770.1 type II toxin-antitoxin system prevent-host-death family antitoxin [Sphingobium sp.]MBP9157756.1 type II toxin-antitoxin system prevent-host-death family antitoxin [Sphingobium sp.]